MKNHSFIIYNDKKFDERGFIIDWTSKTETSISKKRFPSLRLEVGKWCHEQFLNIFNWREGDKFYFDYLYFLENYMISLHGKMYNGFIERLGEDKKFIYYITTCKDYRLFVQREILL